MASDIVKDQPTKRDRLFEIENELWTVDAAIDAAIGWLDAHDAEANTTPTRVLVLARKKLAQQIDVLESV